MNKLNGLSWVLALAGATIASSAGAQQLYGQVGAPGVMVGYATSLGENVDGRVDISTLGRPSENRTVGAIDYHGSAKDNRVALLADWFVASGFHLTGGATFQRATADLVGTGNGGSITIGSNTYVAGPDDQFVAHVTFPDVMPYLGLGYRSRAAGDRGWGFVFDAGLSIGRSTVTGGATGPQLSQVVSPADVQQALDEVKRDADRLHGIPQLSLGASYNF